MLAQQKLEYTDFSAGISENTVPGKPNAYARADNLLITRDKHLETRPGSVALSDTLYVLPALYQRVGSFVNFYNNTTLLAQSGTNFSYQSGSPASWSDILGPTGGKPFAHNTAYSRVYSDQWRQQVFLVTDSGDSPQIFYFDNTNTPQFRTAGLPKPVLQPVYTSASLLTAGISLAVALRAKLLLHFSDTVSHLTAHASAVTALSVLVPPVVLADFITYVGVLLAQYNLHLADANQSGFGQVYHIRVSNPSVEATLGRFAVLNLAGSTAIAAPTDLTTTIAVLNDLRNRYNLHTYATITHQDAVSALSAKDGHVGVSYSTNSTGYGKHLCTTPAVVNNGTTTGVGATLSTVYNPVFSGQLATVTAYLNRIKKEFNTHIGQASRDLGGFGSHSQADTDNVIVAPDATDYFSCYVLLAHLEFFYWWHYKDSAEDENGTALLFQSYVGTATSTSATMTSTSINGSSFIGYYIVNLTAATPWAGWTDASTSSNNFPAYTRVSGGSGTTVVFGAAATGASGTGTWRIGQSKYHFDLDKSGAGSATSPSGYNARVQAFDFTYTSLPSLILSIEFWLGLFKTHELSGWNLSTANGQPIYLMQSGQTVNAYNVHNSNPLAPAFWPESNPALMQVDKTADALYLNTPPVAGSVLYTFVWRYNYTAGGLSFENDSSPALLSQLYWVASATSPAPLTTALYPTTLSNLPVLVNSTGQNWDTTNIVLDVYRTITNGTSFFKVGSVANGVTSFVDNVTDISLLDNQQLYTTGGVLQNDQPPASQFITIMNNTAYYGYCTDLTSGQVFPNRILQSIPFAPYAVPAANFDDLDDALAGLSNFNNYVIAFCHTKIYRMEGSYDELGNGLLTHHQVAPTIGAIGQAGIVQTEYGVFFCGTNGIYWTDGFSLTRVTGELEATYNALIQTPTQRSRVNGVYDKGTRRIYWTFCSTPTAPECDVGYVLDLNWGLSEKMSFTTISGGTSFSPTALVVFNSQLIRGTSYGFIFKHDPQYTSDQTPLLNQASTPSLWAPQAVLYDFESCATNFGSSQIKKWATRITYQGQAKSNLYLQIARKNDNGGGWKQLVPVRSLTAMRWGDPAIKWNDTPTCKWGADGMIDTFRRMPSGSLRCDWIAVQFTNATAIIAGSDIYGVVSVSALAAGSVTLTLPTPYKWPFWATLYTISFQNDGYIKQYTISVRTDQTLTVLDPGATSPAGLTGQLWQIQGIPYGQRFNLTAYNITWAPLADEQAAYHGKTSSDGGANTS